jgi:hypothetical protein
MMSPMSDLLFPSEWGSPEGRSPHPTHSEKGDHEDQVESQDTVTGTDTVTATATDADTGTATDTDAVTGTATDAGTGRINPAKSETVRFFLGGYLWTAGR